MSHPARKRSAKKPALDVRAVILAGGRGTRFWPLGRADKPKQFLRIAGRATMIEETVRRIRPLIPLRKVYTVADAAQTRRVRKLFPDMPAANRIVEPAARNTGPALALATARIWLDNPEAVIVALPADHLIRDEKRFLGRLKSAIEMSARAGAMVIFGIPPTCPATGYGYIRFDRERPRKRGREVFYPVRAFKEKPSVELADEFLAGGDCAWNSGMFVWPAEVFARQAESKAPALFSFWENAVEALRKKDRGKLRAAFEAAPALSIDYALMERAEGVLVSEGDFGWSDIGAWSSLLEVWPQDRNGNAARGELAALDSKGCLVWNPGRLTALVGVRNLIVVDTKDALLVCDADLDQKVKVLVENLKKKRSRKNLL
jgi:mannose-1-phosphate guanylyltransferase